MHPHFRAAMDPEIFPHRLDFPYSDSPKKVVGSSLRIACFQRTDLVIDFGLRVVHFSTFLRLRGTGFVIHLRTSHFSVHRLQCRRMSRFAIHFPLRFRKAGLVTGFCCFRRRVAVFLPPKNDWETAVLLKYQEEAPPRLIERCLTTGNYRAAARSRLRLRVEPCLTSPRVLEWIRVGADGFP